MNNYRSITNSSAIDNALIFCPYWFPLIYLYLVINFPLKAPLIFIAALFLFAETHFASTWLFFFDKENWEWIRHNFYNVFFIPFYTIFIIILIWRINYTSVLLIHYLASGWHVTRQSIGILKLSKSNNNIKIFSIYLISAICLAFGLVNPGVFSYFLNGTFLNILFIIFIISCLLLIKYSTSKTNQYLPFLTGVFIYLPILFIDHIPTALAIGVGMHWCQYISLMWSIKIRKHKLNGNSHEVPKKNLLFSIAFVFSYSLIMTSCTYFGMPKQINSPEQYSYLYLIPLIFQLYHFYIDGYIWRFSDPHIKKSVLPYIFSRN